MTAAAANGSARSSRAERQHPPPFVTPDELAQAQAGSRAAGKADPWTSRYVRGSLSSLAPPDIGGSGGGTSGGAGSSHAASSSSRSPSPAAETIKGTLASNRGLGSAMPSSINRDLRSSGASTLSSYSSASSSNGGRASTSSTSSSATIGGGAGAGAGALGDLSIGSDYSSPTLEGQDGTLSKVVGSLIDPAESRKTWACVGCGVVFARDSTIYASPENNRPPASAHQLMREKKSSSYFCRACFTDRFSIGTCANPACAKPVLGSTKEDGKFVRAGGEAIWHGRCWRCTLCGRGGGNPPLGDGEPIMVGMDGQPTCEDCFGKKRPALVPGPAPASATATVQREGTITKARPHSTTYVSAVPQTKQTFAVPSGGTMAPPPAHASMTTMSGPPQTSLSRGDTIKARPQSLDITPRPGFSRGLSGASLNRFSQQNPGAGNVAELSKRFGSTVSPTLSPTLSPRLNAFTSPTFNSGLFSASSSRATIMPSSPAMATTPTMESCPTPKLTRTNSLTGSPPKPRPLTATFSAEKGFNLSAFNAAGRDVEGALKRSDSRSRSVSPVKRSVGLPPTADAELANLHIGEFGSSSAARTTVPSSSTYSARAAADSPVSGRISPAKSASSSRQSSPERKTQVHEKEADAEDDAMRCAACGLGAFDGPNQSSDDAVLVTLRQGVQLHAECLRCSICSLAIDPQRTFIRLDDPSYAELAPGLGAFAHPKCAPSVVIKRPEPAAPRAQASRPLRDRSVEPSDDDEQHPTHQRAPRPSQETQPPPSSAAANKTILDFSKPAAVPAAATRQLAHGLPAAGRMELGRPAAGPNGGGGASVNLRPSGLPGRDGSPDRFDAYGDTALRRFQPSAGAAPPTRSSLNVTTRGVPAHMASSAGAGENQLGGGGGGGAGVGRAGLSSQRNPAAGIFARRMAEINSKTSTNGAGAGGPGSGGAKLGGMLTCGGCGSKLSMLESVTGPRGTSWHRACLVCGGDRSASSDSSSASSSASSGVLNSTTAARRANAAVAMGAGAGAGVAPQVCGKKLDSGAKVNIDGRVRCRECYDREVAARRLAAAAGTTLAGGHRLAI